MTTFTVTTAADVVDATDGVLSLREAVQLANTDPAAADTIRFAAALEGGTLTLTQGELELRGDVTIDGDRDDDGSRVTFDAGGDSRVLAIRGPGGAEVHLDDLVVTGGYVRDGADGAGIFLGTGNDLTLTGSTVRGNHAGYAFFDYTRGGGIFAAADSSLTLVGSVVRGNTATEYGGGVAAEAGAIVAVRDGRLIGNTSTYGGGIALLDGSLLEVARSLIQDNEGAGYRSSGGGGIFAADSDVRVTASTLSGNNGFYNGGGGIYARDSFVQLTSSTLANNTTSARIFAADGGAVLAQGGVVDLVGCTVTGNRAEGTYAYQPGIGGIRVSDATLLRVANSIVLGNYGTDEIHITRTDIEGTVDVSNGHNILGNGGDETAGDRFLLPDTVFAAIDPMTRGGLLALNGGPTPTVALRDGADNYALSGSEPVLGGDVDQRGFARPQPGTSNPDIGAFELDQTAIFRVPTFRNDVLIGSAAADALGGRSGADLLLGLGGDDRLSGGPDGDTLRGGLGDDVLRGGDGVDTASFRNATTGVAASLASGTATGALGHDRLGSIESLEGGAGGDRLIGDGLANTLGGRQGDDRLFGLTGDDRLHGNAGADILEPGFGSDWADGGAGSDRISYLGDGGPLAVTVDLGRGVASRSGETDRLQGFEDAAGTANADLLRGNGAANTLNGGGGPDRLFGRAGDDTLLGAAGDDRLNGGTGGDTQTGGAGDDLFDFDRIADSAPGAGRDVIVGFAHLADRLDLSTIDARAATAANDAFTFLAAENAAFTAAGQVRWLRSGGDTFVEANVDADLAADLQVELTGRMVLSQADFVL